MTVLVIALSSPRASERDAGFAGLAHQIPGHAVAEIGEHAHPELRAFTAGAGPQTEDVAFPAQVGFGPDGGVEGPLGDLAVEDLEPPSRL